MGVLGWLVPSSCGCSDWAFNRNLHRLDRLAGVFPKKIACFHLRVCMLRCVSDVLMRVYARMCLVTHAEHWCAYMHAHAYMRIQKCAFMCTKRCIYHQSAMYVRKWQCVCMHVLALLLCKCARAYTGKHTHTYMHEYIQAFTHISTNIAWIKKCTMLNA